MSSFDSTRVHCKGTVIGCKECTELFDEEGKIKDTAYDQRVQGMLDELLWYANVLKSGRETNN